MPKKPDYQALALKIIPPSSHRPVSQLRALIASTLESEVTAALARQREEEFPDLVVTRKELEAWRQQLADKEAEIGRRMHLLSEQERTTQQVEQSLQGLVAAFEDYESWLEGEGEIDDNGRRFAALREAYRTYRVHKPKGEKER